MIKDTVAVITWLLLESNVTTYQIAKDLNLSTQFLDGYKNNPEKIIKMTMVKAQLLEEYALAIKYNNTQHGGTQMSKITEVQATIYSELSEKVSAGEISENDVVAIWEDSRGIYAYSLEESDIENHDSVVSVYEALKELVKCI